jgi:hypothetical protein
MAAHRVNRLGPAFMVMKCDVHHNAAEFGETSKNCLLRRGVPLKVIFVPNKQL